MRGDRSDIPDPLATKNPRRAHRFRIDFICPPSLIPCAVQAPIFPMSADLQDTPRPLGEIAIGPSKLDQFLDRNQKGMIGLAIAIALAGGAWIVYRGIERSQQEDAGIALTKAAELTDLQTILKDYPKTPAAGSAQLLAAEKQWATNPDEAIATLRKFIETNPSHPAAPTAQASLGNKLVKQNKTAEAEIAFQAIVDNPSARFLAPYALVQLGDLAKTAGDLKKAESFYQKAENEYPDNHFSQIAKQHLLLLNAKPPVEIDAPPAPPVTPGQSPTGPDLMNPGSSAPFGTGSDLPIDPEPAVPQPGLPQP